MTSDIIVKKVLEILNSGSKTELALNLLLYTDFSRWSQEYQRDFLD